MYARIAKLHHFVALCTDHVVVLAVTVRFFVLCQVAAKLVLTYQVIFYQQIQGVINSCPAHAVVFVFHTYIKRFHIKVPVAGIYFFQDGEALRRFAKALAFQVGGKNLLYLFKFYRI